MSQKNGQTSHVIKLRAATYKKLVGALAGVNKGGWRRFGASRQDRPTMSNIIDEALDRLTERGRSRSSGRR